MINKDFDSWNELKKRLQEVGPDRVVFKDGDIWWCSLGINLGSEQDGKNSLFERPALVLRKFNERMALVIPLTSVIKYTSYHIPLDIGIAILSQPRLISVKRFQRFVKTVSDSDLAMVKKRYIEILDYL